MKVLYLADIRFPMERANGIQTIETCHALARAGVEVDLCVRRTDPRSDEDCLAFYGLSPHPNLRLRRWSVPRKGALPSKAAFTARSLREMMRNPYDIIYTRDLFLAGLALRFRAWHRKAVVYEAHTASSLFAAEASELYRDQKARHRRKLERLARRERRVCRGASGLVTITAALRDCLRELHGQLTRSWVVPDGARVPPSPPPLRRLAAGDPLRLYYIGQLYPWKGVDVLIEAMKELPDEELVIVGGLPPEPDLERTRELARRLGLEGRVHFRGFVPPAALDAERRRADAFVIPLPESATARRFTSPLKLFEAMAAGRPIVASDLPSLREVLAHEVNALLVPPGDPHGLAAAIRRLIEDPSLRERLARRGFEDARGYAWEERGRKLRAVLEETCRSGSF